MTDILKYRIPGEPIIEKKGNFILNKNKNKISGFILSDFNLETIYTFKESDQVSKEKETLFFSRKIPIVIQKSDYILLAKQLLNVFNLFGLAKVVFSRIKKVEFDEKKAFQLFEILEKEYPNTFVYLASGKTIGTWIGATPEILLQIHKKSGFTMSLAGTKQSTESTKWDDKEYNEQGFVSEFILENLERKKYKHIEINGPYEFVAGPVKHLRSDISFDMDKKSTINCMRLLHPTPAVSGYPQKEALEVLETFEVHDRAFYSGVIGVIEKEKSQLYVNLRCCQIKKGAAYLYLGGGYTKDSEPELEWEETENKSKTLLNILQKL